MKVLAINLSTSGNNIGGASIASELHTLYIHKLGIDIQLWRMWSHDYNKVKQGLHIRSFKSKTKLPLLRRFLPKRLISIFLYSDITKNLIKYKPDIVHIHNILPSFELLRICKICKTQNIKIVISTHGFYECFNVGFNFNILEKFIWKLVVTYPVKKSILKIDAFMSLYPFEAKLLKKNNILKSKIFLVPNGVDAFYERKPKKTEIKNVLEKYNINIENPILFFTGNHTSNKGLSVLRKLSRTLNIKSTIIIGGRLSSKNEPIIFSNGNNNKNVKVIFTDFLPIIEQRVLYNISTLLLFPSRSDTLPLTIIEAMACGLPVLAFDVGGVDFLLKDECGFFINPLSTDLFLKKVSLVLRNKKTLEKISKNAKDRQRKIFSWTTAATKAVEIYDEIYKK